MNTWGLSKAGYGDTYYAAAVRSMTMSWKNFFFGAFDPGGFITVDKPPLGFWVQTLSAAIFGFNGVSLLLPEVIAAAASVAVLYKVVNRTFGPVAGLIAALALAVTPIDVATSRNNTVDSILVLVVLLAAWAVSIGLDRGRTRWLILGFVLVGIGFNIKMLQAWLVLPALGAAWLVAGPRSIRTRAAGLAAATLAVIVISASWALLVDAVPAADRPYIGGSATNSVVELALEYNGLDRLNSGFGFPDTGQPGPLRLFQGSVAGQASWLVPFAMVVLLGGALVWLRRWLPATRRARAGDDANHRALARSGIERRRFGSLALWGLWLATTFVFFSIARFWHLHYLVMLAPPAAALTGIGAVLLAREYRHGSAIGWLLPAAIAIGGLAQVGMLSVTPDWLSRLAPVLLAVSLAVAAVLVLVRLVPAWFGSATRLRTAGLLTALGIGALMLTPLTWSLVTVGDAPGGSLPAAGPTTAGSLRGPFGGGRGAPPIQIAPTELSSFLAANRGSARWIVATSSAQSAAPIIVATGEPVMAIGGFTGGDPALTLEGFQALVRAGDVRYVLVGGGPGGFGGGGPFGGGSLLDCAASR
jgi:4-amino-4-deoxy-L-arabinose transferase-like glycosyltransferase